MANRHRVVILGAGFGGLHAAKALKHEDVDITVIDKRNFHLFQPLLYQVATGSLSPGEISAPIRGVLSAQQNTRVLLGEAATIDPLAKSVLLRDGASIPYDSLIVATGSQSTYFGHNEWHKFSPAMKSVEDALAVRHKVLVAFEAAERLADPAERKAWLTFVIVGAGATGCELAGAISEIAHHTLQHDFRSIQPGDAAILIVDGGSRLLPAFPEDLARKAEASLYKLGVATRYGLIVDQVDENGVTVKSKSGDHEHISARTVLWAAGVAVSDFALALAAKTNAPTDKAGHIKVESNLTIPGFPDIFVVGDLAYYEDPNGKPLPGVAQVAMQGGSYAARVIQSRLRSKHVKPFRYFNKGDLAVIGRGSAVANVFGVHLSGLIAWLVWVFIHILYIVEFQNRLLVMVQWGFLYLTYNRGARLITGAAVSDAAAPTHEAPVA